MVCECVNLVDSNRSLDQSDPVTVARLKYALEPTTHSPSD